MAGGKPARITCFLLAALETKANRHPHKVHHFRHHPPQQFSLSPHLRPASHNSIVATRWEKQSNPNDQKRPARPGHIRTATRRLPPNPSRPPTRTAQPTKSPSSQGTSCSASSPPLASSSRLPELAHDLVLSPPKSAAQLLIATPTTRYHTTLAHRSSHLLPF